MRTKIHLSALPFLFLAMAPVPFKGLPVQFLLPVVDAVRSVWQMEAVGTAGLPPEPEVAATDEFPYRLETPHAIFLGDTGITRDTLAQYASLFESTTISGLERDTGLRPTHRKVVFQLYGDEAHWNRETNSSTVWGFYSAAEQRIHMAHWKTPDTVNTLLLAHEFFHWLAWEEGQVNLPTWLNEGLAHNLSWRLEEHTDSWLSPFVRREWLRVANNPKKPVPELAMHTKQDEFTITAVGYLLETRGRGALIPFFERTRSGMEFAESFRLAFGVTPAAFESEYLRQVQQLRQRG